MPSCTNKHERGQKVLRQLKEVGVIQEPEHYLLVHASSKLRENEYVFKRNFGSKQNVVKSQNWERISDFHGEQYAKDTVKRIASLLKKSGNPRPSLSSDDVFTWIFDKDVYFSCYFIRGEKTTFLIVDYI